MAWRLPVRAANFCSNNRVYVQTKGGFTFRSWLEGLQAGRSFITNGPALFLEADGEEPGGRIEAGDKRRAEVRIEWRSFQPLDRIELVRDGEVIDGRGEIPPKPDPAAFVHIVNKHSLPLEQTMGVGDQASDIQAAESAGLSTCYFDPDELHGVDADLVINHYAELLGHLATQHDGMNAR